MSQPKIHVLIAAAGSGTRFDDKSEIPKQYQNLAGKPVLRRTVEAFLSIEDISSIQCIINPNHKELYNKATEGLNICNFIEGSNSRKKSITNGLKDIHEVKDEDIILIHDGARPLISRDDILKLIASLNDNQAASLARPVSETLRKGDQNNCSELVSRDNLWAMQTPQAFRYKDILKAHNNADANTEHTDDTSLATAIGINVKLIQGSAENIKITTKDDLAMAEKLINKQTITRTGLGYDVHAFDEEGTGPIRIGGIDIDHPRTLKGHSDADVALHAITDAILGAVAQGDIGVHFPPSDDAFKNMDSAVFLEKAVEIAKENGASINNIDLTIICEEPKIGPHGSKMKAQIASIVDIPESTINIKATTSEKLGFTGRKEGIAAQAIATVTQYV